VYNGPAEHMLEYFTEQGHVCPKVPIPTHHNL
jgi:hypothetical protein